jgi:uncharacterized protein (DUF1800 family)
MNQTCLLLLSALLLCGCGGESTVTVAVPIPAPLPEPTPEPTPTPIDAPAQASRLLAQASFGATSETIAELVQLGNNQWLEQQLAMPVSSHVQYLQQLEPNLNEGDGLWRDKRMEAWFNHALTAPDQLRQRVAFALSEIFVVSEISNFGDDTYGLAHYYDMLAEHAFGNYRELLEQVTLHPIMGMYLSMLGNEKPNDERNIRPDENYAREALQLFSIGLVQLNQDGSAQLSNGAPIASYDQDIVKAFAHVYTGWSFHGTSTQTWHHRNALYNTMLPMTAVQSYHDTGEKTLLNGELLPANQSAEQDLAMALDNIFNHPNVAPFIGKQLIQRLVTSNPSPAYVARVAALFNDNGQGVRGDLAAVIKGILLDIEASSGFANAPLTFGKIREPIIRATHLWRAFHASSPLMRFHFGWPDYFFNQAPLAAHHVFNFFSPHYAPPGELADAGLLAPELEISTENYVTRTSNFFAFSTLWGHADSDYDDPERILIDLSALKSLANQPEQVIAWLNLVLMANTMSDEMQHILLQAYQQNDNNLDEKLAELVFLVFNSPQYIVQR